MAKSKLLLWALGLFVTSSFWAWLYRYALEGKSGSLAYQIGLAITGMLPVLVTGIIAGVVYYFKRKPSSAMWTWTVVLLALLLFMTIGGMKNARVALQRPVGKASIGSFLIAPPLPNKTLEGRFGDDSILGGSDYLLGLKHFHGDGMPQDYKKAEEFFFKSGYRGERNPSDKTSEVWGNMNSQYALGYMILKGLKPTKNTYGDAAHWFRLAAEKGHPIAQASIGELHHIGMGAAQDFVLAHLWLNLAAATTLNYADTFRKSASKARDAVARKMTPAQIAEAQRLAREWKPKK
jgi:hypothetical protein